MAGFYSATQPQNAAAPWPTIAPPRTPAAYSPDLNPIEQAFAKLKTLIRKAEERTVDGLWRCIGGLLEAFTQRECANYLRNSGYASTQIRKALASARKSRNAGRAIVRAYRQSHLSYQRIYPSKTGEICFRARTMRIGNVGPALAGIAVVARRKADERRHTIFSRNALTLRSNWRIAGNGSASCSMSKRSLPIATRPNDAIQGAMTLGPLPFVASEAS